MIAATPTLRDYRPGEAAALLALFRAAVHQTAAASYDPAQRAAWAPADLEPAEWEPRLAGQNTLLAEMDGGLAGFIAWNGGGYVDLLFTAPAWGRRGIASCLCREAEARMRRHGLREATTRASHLSRPVFERLGWRVLGAETVVLDGVALERFPMQKVLAPPA